MSSEAPIASRDESLQGRAAAFVWRNLRVTSFELLSSRRESYLVTARTLFVWCVRWSSPTVSYPTIGRWIERHHTSVIHLARKASDMICRDPEFAALCEDWKATERARMEVPYACD